MMGGGGGGNFNSAFLASPKQQQQQHPAMFGGAGAMGMNNSYGNSQFGGGMGMNGSSMGGMSGMGMSSGGAGMNMGGGESTITLFLVSTTCHPTVVEKCCRWEYLYFDEIICKNLPLIMARVR